MIEITIDGKKIKVEEGSTILSAAEALGIYIPTLCFHSAVKPKKVCRVCSVEVTRGEKVSLLTACNFKVKEPLSVETQSEKVLERRSEVIKSLLTDAPGALSIAKMAKDANLEYELKEDGVKCIRCGLCVRVCEDVIGKKALTFEKDGKGTPYKTVNDDCIGCATCAAICPTGAIKVTVDGKSRKFPQGKKSFDVVTCSECGGVITTKEHFKYIKESADIPDDILGVCAVCKKASYSEKVATGETISL